VTPPSPSLPDAEELRRLEDRARSKGSGLTANDLPGRWRLQQVWSRSGTTPQATASALLRALDACLEIGSAAPGEPMPLRNSVSLGILELRFEGEGKLTGRRPLLRFWFNGWQLRLAGRPWIGSALARPAERSLPFFALIGQGEGGEGSEGRGGDWLAARGRGGGLALWRRAPSVAPAPGGTP
jgi:hypothetical protein